MTDQLIHTDFKDSDSLMRSFYSVDGDIDALRDVVCLMSDGVENYHLFNIIYDRLRADFSKLFSEVISLEAVRAKADPGGIPEPIQAANPQ